MPSVGVHILSPQNDAEAKIMFREGDLTELVANHGTTLREVGIIFLAQGRNSEGKTCNLSDDSSTPEAAAIFLARGKTVAGHS